MEQTHLYLKTIALGYEQLGGALETALACPHAELFGLKAQPEIAAVFSGPRLVVATQFTDNHPPAWT